MVTQMEGIRHFRALKKADNLLIINLLVGKTGFEPATTRPPALYATGLVNLKIGADIECFINVYFVLWTTYFAMLDTPVDYRMHYYKSGGI